MSKTLRAVYVAAAVAPLALIAACSSSSSPPAPTSSSTPSAGSGHTLISETGSTLLFPLFGTWQTEYSSKVDPSVTITSGATGSGTGIADAGEGLVTVGASDAYLSSSNLAQYPGLLNIPVAVAAVDINYNVTGVHNLKLNGTVLAKIYAGKITTWNDSAIKALNPGVKLPSEKIVTLHRADSSGSTFLTTSYLNAQDPADWPSGNVGTTITWPSVPGSLAETGSGGMLTACGTTKGCIAYLGISYLTKAITAGLGTASVANGGGKFVQPTPGSISAALASFPAVPASGAQSLINTKAAAGYPIINYEYAVVKKTQPNASQATAVKKFLTWIVTSGNSSTYLSPVGFVALPSGTASVATSLINSVS